MASTTRKRNSKKQTDITPNEAVAIAKEACIYAFPMIDNYRILYGYFVNKEDEEYKGDWNVIHHEARVHAPGDTSRQTPNLDTACSILGADLRTEPLVLTMPKLDNGRYYSVQFIDLYTFNFFYVGTRATGNEPGTFLLAGPRWKGQRIPGIKRVIRSETDLVLAIYRTQLMTPGDIDNVKKIQTGYLAQSLCEFLDQPAPAPATDIKFIEPVSVERERTSLEFLNILNFLLQFCSIHPSELQLMSRFARLGIKPAQRFYTDGLSPQIHQAVEDGISDAWKSEAGLLRQIAEGRATGVKLFGSREYLENNYLNRMAGAATGIHANSWEEAIHHVYYFDSAGHTLDASRHQYRLRFRGGQLPPASAFWSVTLYELPSESLNANSINRYLINSLMLATLQRDADGGLSIYIKHDPPEVERMSNWLPAPQGTFKIMLRIYAPRPEIANWKAPSLDRPKKVVNGQ